MLFIHLAFRLFYIIFMFYFKTILFLLIPVIGLYLYPRHQLIDRISFRNFRIYCFLSIAWLHSVIFWVSTLSWKYFDLVLPLV